MPKQNRKTSSRITKARKTSAKRTSPSRRTAVKVRGSRGHASGELKEPKSPMPAQHQQKPGIESKMNPRPNFRAAHYKGADKLDGKVALITGGDSGIGRAVAVFSPARAPM